MKLKPYPKYKDSGIEWLGEVPEGWEIKRLRYLISRNDGGVWGNDTINDEGDIVLRSTEVNINGSWSIQEPAFRKLSASEKKKALLEFGDILVTKSSGSKEHIGKSAYVDKEIAELKACFSNFMQRLRTIDKYFGKFIYYILNNHIGREQMNFLGQTTTGLINLNGSVLGEIKIAYPSKEDATKLIDFLDQKTSRIDELIKKNERLIELLKEKRQAIISHAVTKGLDPNAKMKDTGIEWLGKVPEGWEVKRLKFNLQLLTKKMDRRESPVALENIESWSGRYKETETEFQGEGVAFEKGDILFGKLRPYLAKAWLADFSGEAIGDFFVMRPLVHIDGRFAVYQILNKEFISIVDGSTFGAKMPRVSWDFMANLRLPTPSIEEQTAIADYLDRETVKIDGIISKIQSQIAVLKEYRQALISNVVTGKARVN